MFSPDDCNWALVYAGNFAGALGVALAAFVAAGFEHSVANMYFVPFALLLTHLDPAFVAAHAPGAHALSWSGFLVRNLLPVTLGNVIGGTLLVGGTYWFIYLRPGGERHG